MPTNPVKRLIQTALPLLLILSSLGHVFAAALCPGRAGRDCFVTRAGKAHDSSHSHEAPTTPMPEMAGHCASHAALATETAPLAPMQVEGTEAVAAVPASHSDQAATLGEVGHAEVSRFNEPTQSCAHCFRHSGPFGLPLTSLGATDHAGKHTDFLPLPVSKLLVGPADIFGYKDLARDHAPPGNKLPRYLVVNVFLI